MAAGTKIKENIKTEIKKPSMYRVVLLNDDYTPMEFVVSVLIKVFRIDIQEATKIMLDVHNKGKGIVGMYTYDIAMTKSTQVMDIAKANGYPLKTTVEEV